MSRSFAQTLALPCGNCGHSFMADVWLIVDAVERPDLVERIHAETIHSLRCAHCGTIQPLDAPLLFHDEQAQRLIFAAQADATTERSQELARQLGQQLIGSIAPHERQPYLAQAEMVSGIAELHAALDRAAAARGDELSRALPALMAALDPAQLADVVREHPVLERAETLEQLRAYVEQLRAEQHHALADGLEQRIAALGTRPASEQPHPARQILQALLEAESPEQRRSLLRRQAELITPELVALLEGLAAQAQRQQIEAVARDLLVIRDEVRSTINERPPTNPPGT